MNVPDQVQQKLFAIEAVARAFRLIVRERYNPSVERRERKFAEQNALGIKLELETISAGIAGNIWEEWLVLAVSVTLGRLDEFCNMLSKQPVIENFKSEETCEAVNSTQSTSTQNISMTQAIQSFCKLRGKDVSLAECEMALIRMIPPEHSYDFDKPDLVLSSAEWLCGGSIVERNNRNPMLVKIADYVLGLKESDIA